SSRRPGGRSGTPSAASSPPRSSSLTMTREIGAVVLGLAVAALALREALGLPIGTVRNPGEGFFPLWLAVLLVALSVLLLAHALTPANLFYCFVGSLVGTAIGVLPGLGPPATIALLLPVTYGIPATSAVILLAGIFYGAMYGGSTTSILLNIPGEAASVVTCLDGYQMARQGRAGAALAI